MKHLLPVFFLAAACAMQANEPYKVIATLSQVEDGDMAYLYNFDTGEKFDSVLVDDHAAVFTGEIDEPITVRIIANGNRMGTFILESGTTAFNGEKRRAAGSMLNDIYNAYNDSINAIAEAFKSVPEEEKEAVLAQAKAFTEQTIKDNIDSPVGFLVFLDYPELAEPAEVMQMIEDQPELKEYTRVQNLIKAQKLVEETSEGHKFKDFAVEYDGATHRLSDYAGKDKYVLVDFWASWCGPCMHEIETLREIRNLYPEDQLEILGVAVWDEPQNTLAAINRKNISWPCIINAQTIPTDLYGIQGIPCIILISPDGTIISRGLQGDRLKQAVADALN